MRRYLIILLISFLVFPLVAQNTNCACCSEKYQEFDFWIGTWVVTNANGTPAGKNTIKKIQDNCALLENWTSATPGFTGTSQNFYNAKSKQWEQIWIDNQGSSLHLKGHKIGNQMVLESEKNVNTKGQVLYHRITWTQHKDGTVRQLWETITDNTNVVIAFDGIYTKEN